MASNQTPVYGLNQWSLEDSVIMEEFNTDNRNIEQALLELKAAMPKIAVGTYVGTGTYGAENPNTLTFDFTPKLVIINGILEGGDGVNLSDHYALTAVRGAAKCHASYWDENTCVVYLSWGEQSLSWYSSESKSEQGNWKDATYHYIAIG